MEAVDDYLATCEEQRKSPSKIYSGAFNVRVPKEIHQKLDQPVHKNGMKLNEVVRKSLIYTVENEKEVLKNEK